MIVPESCPKKSNPVHHSSPPPPRHILHPPVCPSLPSQIYLTAGPSVSIRIPYQIYPTAGPPVLLINYPISSLRGGRCCVTTCRTWTRMVYGLCLSWGKMRCRTHCSAAKSFAAKRWTKRSSACAICSALRSESMPHHPQSLHHQALQIFHRQPLPQSRHLQVSYRHAHPQSRHLQAQQVSHRHLSPQSRHLDLEFMSS